jgi:hypothetical protein
MTNCKHCKREFDKKDIANHSRWCDLNPKRNQYNEDLSKARAAKKNFNNQYTYGAVLSNETKEKLRLASTGKKHTKETKQLLKEKALTSTHRRLRKGVVEYKGVLLDSSWELKLANRLDELNIKWFRPDPIPWIDEEGVTHNYFPDFYLPEYDKYLDPKNKHAIKVQGNKLKILLAQYKNIDIIDSLEGCRTFTI